MSSSLQFRKISLAKSEGRAVGSIMVEKRLQDAIVFVSSVETLKHKAAACLGDKLAPWLQPGEVLPDYALDLALVARGVDTAIDELLDAQERCEDQKRFSHELSHRCDRLVKDELYPRTVRLRRSIDSIYGKKQGELIHGIKGRLPTWRDGLRAQVGRTLHLLENKTFEMPATEIPGFGDGSCETWSAALRPAYEELDECLDELVMQNLKRQSLGDARQRSMKKFDDILRLARRHAESVYERAGIPKLQRGRMRAYYERRDLKRRARARRESRRLKALAARDGAGGSSGSTTRPVKPWRFAHLIAWLRASRSAGGRLQRERSPSPKGPARQRPDPRATPQAGSSRE